MAEFTVYEGQKRGEWEVLDPKGHFLISEWVSKKEAQSIANHENKKLQLKGEMFGLDLQLLVANLIPLDRLTVDNVNEIIDDLFTFNDADNLKAMKKNKEFLKECIIAIIYQ